MDDTTNGPGGWAWVRMRPRARDYLREAALMVPALVGGAIGVYAGLLGGWAGVPAAVWWVLVGFAVGEVADGLVRVVALVRARAVVMRCIGCGLHVPAGRDGAPGLVAHLGACAPAGGSR